MGLLSSPSAHQRAHQPISEPISPSASGQRPSRPSSRPSAQRVQIKLQGEDKLRRSGLTYFIVRPGEFEDRSVDRYFDRYVR